MRTPVRAWDDWVVELLRAGADLDLRVDGEARPRLVAADGDVPLMYAEVRPFAKGAYHQPLMELMALALPLGTDRVAVGVTGRVSSSEDPIPPALEGVGDLRQRVLVIELIDGHRPTVLARSLLLPFSTDGADVDWQEPFDPGPGEGWIAQALALLIDQREQLQLTPEEILEQAGRCVALGHRLALLDGVADRLGTDRIPRGGAFGSSYGSG